MSSLYDTGVSLSIIPLKLAQELQKLSFTKDELKVVVEDLVTGNTPTAPSTSAPGGIPLQSLRLYPFVGS